MRAIIQRVTKASVGINRQVTAIIGHGILLFIGIEEADTVEDIQWLSKKITQLRIFNDADGIMNLSVKDIDGEMLVISQFTLHAKTRKGNRPSYIKAAHPDIAIPVYEQFIKQLKIDSGLNIQTGEFGAMMEISLINDGPVTIIIDTKNRE